MKTKLFTLLTLLLCLGSSEVWAQSAITVTYAYDQINAKGTGSASVADIISGMSVSLQGNYQSFNGTGTAATWNSVSVPVYSKVSVSSDGTTSASDYVRFTITPAAGYVFSPSSVSLGAIREGTDGGSMTIKANSTTLTESTLSKTSVVPGRNKNSDASHDYLQNGYSFSYNITSTNVTNEAPLYIDVCMSGLKNKSWGLWNVVITGTYESESMTKLTTPSISLNQSTGVVTINDIDANATKVTYTTNGTDPTASSTTYDASNKPVIDANCTIKAMAIGDGGSYSNSNIASLAAKVTVENPVITAHNGTVQLTCATDGATIKYNFDNGESWNTYSLPFTLFTGQTVYAKAEHASYKNNSSTVNQSVAAAPAAKTGSQTKILGFVTPGENNWEYMTANGTNYGISGKADTAEEGWSLWISPNGSSSQYDKGISGDSSGNSTYTISGNNYQYIKNSNGRQFNIGMPSNLRANRLTIYSWNNGDGTTIWSPVGGNTFTTETEVPIVSRSGATPEIRVFTLDDIANNIAINNAGYQQCFIVVVDYTIYVPGPTDAEDVKASANITETVTFTKSPESTNKAVIPNTVASIITIASPSLKATSLAGYAGALELGSNTTITISLPESATGASVTLVDEASNSKKLKVDGTDDSSRTWTGNDTDGYSTTINIPDAKAGSNFVIAKKDTGTRIVKITLTYTADVPTGNITLTTTDNMAGWRAFYDGSNGYTVDANTKVYIAKESSASTVTLKEINDIPAATPVILKTSSAANSHKMTLTKANSTTGDATGNLLSVSTAEQDLSAGVYRLGYGVAGVGLYPWSTSSAAAGIVYISIEADARVLNFVFDDEETTGISDATRLNDNGQLINDGYFDLQGRKVAQPTKGLYIVNGRKVVIK